MRRIERRPLEARQPASIQAWLVRVCCRAACWRREVTAHVPARDAVARAMREGDVREVLADAAAALRGQPRSAYRPSSSRARRRVRRERRNNSTEASQRVALAPESTGLGERAHCGRDGTRGLGSKKSQSSPLACSRCQRVPCRGFQLFRQRARGRRADLHPRLDEQLLVRRGRCRNDARRCRTHPVLEDCCRRFCLQVERCTSCRLSCAGPRRTSITLSWTGP